MILRSNSAIIAVTFLGALTSSCGKKDEDEKKSGLSIPSISFDIPAPAGAELTNAVPGNDILSTWQLASQLQRLTGINLKNKYATQAREFGKF